LCAGRWKGKLALVQRLANGSCGARFPTEIYTRGVPLSFTPLLRLKRCHACDQWHSSREFTPLTGWHCKLGPNTEGTIHHRDQGLG
jgi:hypothetical protein